MSDDASIWWEIQVTDLEQAKAFYGAVFGWTFKPFGENYDAAFLPDGRMFGGLDAGSAPKESPAGRHVRVTFHADDLEGTFAKVRANGGTVLQERTEIPDNMGWYGTFADPTGMKLGLSTGNPAKD